MKNLKLISVRLRPELLQKLDETAAQYDYYSRSAIINNLLQAVLTCSEPDVLWRLISTYYPDERCFRISFEVDQDLLKERRKNNQTLLHEI